ncbi:MAG: BrnT family toxin [Candidatus Magnetobacterium sp. LHC-1]|uniref:BrnT family toxin n=1 Tax=Candidatus Magnetobacterium casense TaxID=1455061 RepID=A0ABS6RZN0_9BACT|nr:BrnT family toxin [Candidatus Magnetobacterium casensis]MBF0606406.1 BrnT family toxin [Nitrospirota bacterium]MBV6342080.1 BrnT family toxin [Candidatus Magnetobacterium casensis]
MVFEWDELKRLTVMKARNLDFADATTLFDGRYLHTVASPRGTEERWLSIGELGGLIITVVWTWRDDAIRIITMRRARYEEKRAYSKIYN